MTFVPFDPPSPDRGHSRWFPWLPVLLGGGVALLVAAVALPLVILPILHRQARPSAVSSPTEPAPTVTAAPTMTDKPLTVVPPPANLPVIDYGPAPGGFPADPTPLSTVRLGDGLHPTDEIGAYDAPGGRPLAFLAPDIEGVPLTMPIVERRSDWAAVLLPSANRQLAWVPPGSWTTVPLRDLLIVVRRKHQLIWLRDDKPVQSWQVTLGLPATPTPLGRTFLLGRSALDGEVYAGLDVFALGAVPDDPDAVPPGLRGAHIGLHTWYNDDDLGGNTTDGCIRLTRSGHQRLLSEVIPGTELVVVDDYTPPSPAATRPPTASRRLTG
jgi:L,D-transpeptidase catalytic domain